MPPRKPLLALAVAPLPRPITNTAPAMAAARTATATMIARRRAGDSLGVGVVSSFSMSISVVSCAGEALWSGCDLSKEPSGRHRQGRQHGLERVDELALVEHGDGAAVERRGTQLLVDDAA